MPANLATAANGDAMLAYYGETPWHGLGQSVAAAMTSAEAIAAAHLDWRVEMEDVQTTHGRTVPMGAAAVREDTGDVLGLVGRKWKPVQNADAFTFLDSLVADGSIRYHTAGGLGKGERVWMLAKFPDSIGITGTDDVSDKYLLLSNGHDGYTSLRVFFTPIRVVCQNTLTVATNTAARNGVHIRHTGDILGKLDEARRVLGLADAFFERFSDAANAMAARKMNGKQVLSYFQHVYPLPADAEKSKTAQRNAETIHASLTQLFESGRGNDVPKVRGSLWAAYNAVTEFVDYARPKSERKAALERPDNRLNNAWFGVGSTVKGRAFEEAMSVLKREFSAN